MGLQGIILPCLDANSLFAVLSTFPILKTNVDKNEKSCTSKMLRFHMDITLELAFPADIIDGPQVGRHSIHTPRAILRPVGDICLGHEGEEQHSFCLCSSDLKARNRYFPMMGPPSSRRECPEKGLVLGMSPECCLSSSQISTQEF